MEYYKWGFRLPLQIACVCKLWFDLEATTAPSCAMHVLSDELGGVSPCQISINSQGEPGYGCILMLI